jgi:O-antigen/teichoic acid export membrane protein
MLWSVGGSLLPLPVAVLVIRPLFVGLGAERFGVLALAWALMGYFNLFDLGMGRATTNQLAEARASAGADRTARIFWSSISSHVALGLAGGVLLALAAPILVDRMLTLSPDVAAETRQAFLLLALSVPFIVWSTASRAVLEGFGRFDLVASGNVVTATLVYLLPLGALAIASTLPAVIGAVIVARIIGLALFGAFAFHCCPQARVWSRPSLTIARAMLGQGRWLTVSAAITPALSTADRFILASAVSAAVVGFYSIPYDILTRLWLLTGAVLRVLFPAFSGLTAANVARLEGLLARSATALVAGLAPVLAIIIAGAPAVFDWWLGPAFSAVGAPVAQALALGMLFSAIAHLCGMLLQAVRRAGVVAALDVAQFVTYALVAWHAAQRYGPVGVAVVWMLRAVVQACVVMAACHLSRPLAPVMPSRAFWARRLGPALLLCAAGWIAAGLSSTPAAVVLLGGALIMFASYTWTVLLDDSSRAILLRGGRAWRPAAGKANG